MPSWHALSPSEVAELLKTNPERGLSREEAKKRLERYGPNEIPEERRHVALQVLLGQVKSLLVLLLVFAVAASVAIGELADATAIAVILVLNIALGFVQEYRAERAIELLKKLAVPKARVVRDGVEVEVPSTEVVPGDVIVVRAGDRVPADARLVEAANLRVDEAVLTGESEPVEKVVDPLPEDAPLPERRNMLFMGTTVTYGRGRAVVVATGLRTEFGRIAEFVRRGEREVTPLQRRMEHLGRVLTAIILVLVALVLVEELMEGLDAYEALMTSISLAVSAVPEGLPAVLTITLALGVQRMARRNAIVRRLASVETLGSATVICTDKTGTLTKNEMTVVRVFASGRLIEVTGAGYDPEGELREADGSPVDLRADPTLVRLLEAGLLCNDSSLVREGSSWRVAGDPTEGALVVLALKAGLSEGERRRKPRFSEVPFDSARKRMSTAHVTPDGKRVMYMKGAPSIVLELCDRIEERGRVRELTDEDREAIMEVTSRMAREALRVLALAYRELPETTESISEADERRMIFLGLVGMMDPPRPEVPEAIRKAREAGIKVVMVTGDHRDTAVAIAKQVGIIQEGDDPLVLTGSDLDRISDDELYEVVEDVAVYARVSPGHKTRIVRALKRRGHVVAMTGDGINDAPSLRVADIGVAMGIRGSDVTREVADLVLADDNFATIVAAVEEGRTIYDNIRKFIRLLLSANWDEIIAVFASAMLDLPLPFTPAQILWINLVTDGLPALALGVDPPEPGVMKRPPRDPRERVYSGMELFFAVSVALALFSWIAPFWFLLVVVGRPLAEARTMAFTQAVIFELILALNARSEERFVLASRSALLANKHLLAAVLGSLALHLAVLYAPPLQLMFDTVPLDTTDWLFALAFGSLSAPLCPRLLDTRRLLRRRGRAT
ncbi:MAG: ATPase [Thermoprotei archaeon]|nr:MAG: ATPase [Thermoprotei archaeon]